MDWYLPALALYLTIDVMCFVISWAVLRSLRKLTAGRMLTAFVLAWLCLPIVSHLAGTSPVSFMQSAIWFAALMLNALFLYALGRPPASP
jgi:hypothetical protein